jgi:SAM-dependent methyltransferase
VDQTRKIAVLNAGSGPARTGRLHEFFSPSDFDEVRLDIDPRAKPDLLGSFRDMRGLVEDARFDAIWSSHSLEHLESHEVLPALEEFRRVLRPNGFVIVTCPNLAAVVRLLESEDVESIVYTSPAGPIRILDILYGHSPSIEAGHSYMAHHTGFTAARLGRLATQAGFSEARVFEGDHFDLWAAFLMPGADPADLARRFAETRIATLFGNVAPAPERPAPPNQRNVRVRRLCAVAGGEATG